MNLFFVHTPIQLIIAQNLVSKLNLKHNYLVLGYTGVLGKDFYSTYDTLLIDSLWDKKYDLGDILHGVIDIKSYFKCVKNFRKFNTRLVEIISDKSFTDIYFGDINHYAYLFIAEKYKKNRRFYFFEEGLSHYSTYTLRKKFEPSFFVSIKSLILNLNYYFYGVFNFSDYYYSTKDVVLKFNLIEKFSIISNGLSTYKFVPFSFQVSDKLNQILEIELENINNTIGKRILYLSTTSTIEFTKPEEDEKKMLDIIFNSFDRLSTTVLLKFHPKDIAEKKDFVRKYFNSRGIKYFEVLENYKLPIEVIYDKFRPDLIVGYDSSSLLYGQVMQSSAKVVSMLPYLLEYYSSIGISNPVMTNRWKDVESTQLNLLGKEFDKLKFELIETN